MGEAPTNAELPSSTSILEAEEAARIQQKYAEERSKRLRLDGAGQYIEISKSEKFKHYEDDPWLDPDVTHVQSPPLNDGSHCDFLILGAGLNGLVFAVRLIQQGVPLENIRLVDSAGGFGGTWYWNRYPGLMCDMESYIYMPLLEETGYMPKNKYASGDEIREHAERIADHWELRNKTLFQTKVTELKWDENDNEWIVKMIPSTSNKIRAPSTVRARFVLLSQTILDGPKLPDIPGLGSFQGKSFHSSRWDYEVTGGTPTDPSLIELKDKTVGILGTGATCVQALPHLARWAKKVYVFQRTPSAVDSRDNRPTDPDLWACEIANTRGWQRKRMENFNEHFYNITTPRPSVDLVADRWTEVRSYGALIGSRTPLTLEYLPEYLGILRDLDMPRQERIRDRVSEIVKEKDTAEKLKAWYPTWCKRPCFHDEYLDTFNRTNVTLVDTDGKGIEKITERGIVANGEEYPLDLLIFSTGFRAPSNTIAARLGITIHGRNGYSLEQKWADQPATLHGVLSRSFPNLFLSGPTHTAASPNQTSVIETLAEHISYIVTAAAQRTAALQSQTQSPNSKETMNFNFVIEPTAEAEEYWCDEIAKTVLAFAGIAGCTPSYLNREGVLDRAMSKEEQVKFARGAIWGRGIEDLRRVLGEWREEGRMWGLDVRPVDAKNEVSLLDLRI